MHIAFTTPLPTEGFTRLSDHRLGVPMAEAEILVSTFDKPVSAEMIAAMPRLRLIANLGVGFNNIDLAACAERDIVVTNTPKPVIEPTAELALALMVDVSRRVSEFDRHLRLGTGEPFGVMNNLSHSLYGKTLGIIGMGNIGQSLARRAVAMGMQIVYHNRHRLAPDIEQRYGARYVSQDELLAVSDYVSLNLPYCPEVHHLIGEDELRRMKPTAYLINTARGAHVCERALVRALQEGWIAGAALDVYEHEPEVTQELKALDNVVLSPHTGTGTWEGRIAMCHNVEDNILAYIEGKEERMDIVNRK